MKPLKFNPTNINDFENLNLVEDWSFEDQKRVVNEDPFMEQLLRHKEEDMKMKVQWSNLLKWYLINFTILMFITLWGATIIFHLQPITLNFLITVGFAKVVGVVWIIVRHLFPDIK